MKWLFTVKLRHLFTKNEDYESIQKSMNDIADALKKESCFHSFNAKGFREIPNGDDIFGPVDYANKLIDRMYDYADENRIWIE